MLLQPHYVRDYRRMVSKLWRSRPLDEAANQAIGGNLTIGPLQRDIMRDARLQQDDYVIDVGCGSGRTALALRDMANLRYLGTDVVPELIDYARCVVDRQDWKFVVVESLSIPERDEQADIVIMFSVLTHLEPRECLLYLADAVRVLKPDGRVIASFLDPAIGAHRQAAGSWFAQVKGRLRGVAVKSQLLEPEQIAGWARSLNLTARFQGPEQIGQSYVVLTKAGEEKDFGSSSGERVKKP